MLNRAGCELRRSPGLAGEFSPKCGPMRGLPVTPPGFSTVTLAGSAKRFVAVTCAVSIPPYSRASATAFLFASRSNRERNKCNPFRLPVFPSTKFAMIVGGRSPLWIMVCRECFCGAGVNEKTSTELGANSHEDDRSDLSRPLAASEKAVPANRADRRLLENLHAGSCLFEAAQPGRRIPRQG